MKNLDDPTKPTKKEAPVSKGQEIPQPIPQQLVYLMPGQQEEEKKEKTPLATSISIGSEGIHVASNTLSPKMLEKLTDRLIQKHQKFMLQKKKNKTMLGVG